jgi:2-keto-3-deoxy-L-rhamnonate aldolase RhmA
MGLAGLLEHPDVQGAVRRVVAASVRRGVAPGIHLIHPARIPEQLERAVADGMRFIALGSDALVLGDGYRGLADLARDLKGRAASGR